MKKTLALIGLFTFFSFPASSNNTGISVNIGQPGFYGQINLGNQGLNPRLIYSNPIVHSTIPKIAILIDIPQKIIIIHNAQTMFVENRRKQTIIQKNTKRVILKTDNLEISHHSR